MNQPQSVTLRNLESAFAGESMAHIKYRYFARIAREQGDEETARVFEATADQEVAWRSFTAQDGWHLDTLLIRRQAFQRIGPFDPAWMIDTVEWLWRARRLGLCTQVLPQVVAWRRIHGDNHSIRARLRAHAEYFRLIRLVRAHQQDSV